MDPNSSSASEDRSRSGCNDGAHDDLHRLRVQLREILESIHTFESPIRPLPVLDVSLANDDPARVGGVRAAEKAVLPGLRGLEESVRRDLDVLTKVRGCAIQGVLSSRLIERID